MAHEQSFQAFHQALKRRQPHNGPLQAEGSIQGRAWVERQGPIIQIWLLVMVLNLAAILFLG